MTQQTAPIKNCLTCAHRIGWDCALSGYSWRIQRQFPDEVCDEQLSSWVIAPDPQPEPKRRSFRQWVYETFLA